MEINDKIILKAGVLYTTIAKTLDSWSVAEREIREEFENQIGSLIISITSNKFFQTDFGTLDAFNTKTKYGKTKAQSNKIGKDSKIITEAIYPKNSIAKKLYKMIDKDEINNLEDFINALSKYASRVWITQAEKYNISDYIKSNKNRAKHAFKDMNFKFVNIDSGKDIKIENIFSPL